MALPTDTMTAGVGGALTADIPLLWGKKINDYFRYNLSLAQFFIDRSDELADGGSDVYTPTIVAMSTATKSNATTVTLFQKMGALTSLLRTSIMSVYEMLYLQSNNSQTAKSA